MASFRVTRTDRRPLYSWLIAFAVSCFLGTLATDLAYWRTADVMWADFSDWLVTIGVIAGYAALVVALIETLLLRSGRFYRPTLLYAIGMIVALILATINMLIHTRDAWTSVVPWGVVLSAIVVVIALAAGWATNERYRGSYAAAGSREPTNPKVTG
jgi:uncharacterized membrane protein